MFYNITILRIKKRKKNFLECWGKKNRFKMYYTKFDCICIVILNMIYSSGNSNWTNNLLYIRWFFRLFILFFFNLLFKKRNTNFRFCYQSNSNRKPSLWIIRKWWNQFLLAYFKIKHGQYIINFYFYSIETFYLYKK